MHAMITFAAMNYKIVANLNGDDYLNLVYKDFHSKTVDRRKLSVLLTCPAPTRPTLSCPSFQLKMNLHIVTLSINKPDFRVKVRFVFNYEKLVYRNYGYRERTLFPYIHQAWFFAGLYPACSFLHRYYRCSGGFLLL